VDALDIARWQFGITTVYHYFLVPISIGLSALVAILETAWVRTGKEHYLRATKFWGKLFLINVALGVATGLIQEFQFGMAWSDYSRFVGDVLGAPLAIEALLAFFLESTFLGLWIFGWDRLPKALHAATMWIVAIGTQLSAYFILAANSWMQHPVGDRYDAASGRAELTDFGAVLTNSTVLVAFPHTITAAFVTAGALMIGISAWHLARRQHLDVFRPSLKLGLWVTVVASMGVAFSGDVQGKIMTEQQPMKMAAAEALYETTQPAAFSIFTIGSLDGSRELFSIRVPRVLSFVATGSLDGEVEGINDVQAAEQARFGPGDYKPLIPITYWSFRFMIGAGLASAGLAALGLWLTRRGRLPKSRWFWRAAIWSMGLPLVANAFGWIFTEMGRQPWAVYGVLRTSAGESPDVPPPQLLTSLIVLTLLYVVLAVVEVRLLAKYAKAGPPELVAPDEGADRPLAFAY
jgi:cytochrome d ubiquinol oxidase subunit I